MNISIPSLNDPDLSGIKIRDCGEPLKQVLSDKRIHVIPAYAGLGFRTASNSILLRSGAFAALQKAANTLPQQFTLIVWDGLRTLATQQEIAERFDQELIKLRVSQEQRVALAKQYIAPVPQSKHDLDIAPPAHATGGAVDVTLGDVSGLPLDLGAGFDEFSEVAWLDHFESLNIEGNQIAAHNLERRDLRRILYWTMINAGFSPYKWEFWHFEFRTRRAAAFHQLPFAEYGAALPWE